MGERKRGGPKRLSLRSVMYIGFAALALVSAGYALWSVYALERSGRIVRQTYDRSLMAINYARAAEANTERLLRQPETREAYLDEVLSDLDVVLSRSSGPAFDEAERLRAVIAGWKDGTPDDAAMWSDGAFDLLTELLAADSFIEREEAIDVMERSSAIAVAGMVAIIAALLATALLLSRFLISPLRGLAKAAEGISAGNFETPLPGVAGRELGTLVGSMRAMQGNIAERIAAETLGRTRAESRLHAAIAHAADAMVILDERGRIVLCNDAARAIAPSGSIEPGKCLEASLRRTDLSDIAVRTLAEGGLAELPSGRWIKAAHPAPGDDGSVIVWSDVTGFKDREQALNAANEAKTRFMAVMSHELRTPLNAVIGFAELIRDEALGPAGHDDYKQFASQICESGSGLLRLINDVLDFASVQDRRYFAGLARHDIAPALRELVEEMRTHPSFANRTLDATIAAELPQVYARTEHLARAFRHLLLNAAQFSHAAGTVTLTAGQEQDTLAIRVEDNGKGMDARELDRALQVFEQGDGSSTRSHEGIGIGIPFARAIVEAHGGTFAIESEAGRGTRIAMSLPLAGWIDKDMETLSA